MEFFARNDACRPVLLNHIESKGSGLSKLTTSVLRSKPTSDHLSVCRRHKGSGHESIQLIIGHGD